MSDKDYWNDYYSEEQIDFPSDFAQVARSYMEADDHVIELGCGSGRDLQYFAESGLRVTGLDSSSVAVKHINEKYRLPAITADFTVNPQIPTNHVYSRWTLHSVDLVGEANVLSWVSETIPVGGYLFVELRTTKDHLYGQGEQVGKNAYVHTHYRRFTEPYEFVAKIYERGFDIVHITHGQGLSVMDDNDPHLMRVVAQRQ